MNLISKLLLLTGVLMGASVRFRAQEPIPQGAFTSVRLEQMVAPIALYPDALVAQILMAATYPLEVVEADRWVEKHPDLKGPALEEALKQFEWDPSIKAICGFPTVLKEMSDNLDWTRDLGDAFLGQPGELMDTIQRMRQKASEAGTLKTTEEQRVTQDSGAVVIEPVNPEVIYVPSYSPLVVYGGWYYPWYYYPNFYYPPAVGWGYLGFGIGFAWGVGVWGGCDWHHHSVYVHEHHYNDFNKHTCHHPKDFHPPHSSDGHADWQHDPDHRKGVGYRNSRVAEQYGAQPGTSRVTRDQARGYSPSGGPASQRLAPPPTPGTRSTPPTGIPPSGGVQRTTPPIQPPSGGVQRTTPPPSGGVQRTTPPSSGGVQRTTPPSSGGVQRTTPPQSGGVQRTTPPARPPSGGVQRTSPPVRPPSGGVRSAPSGAGATQPPSRSAVPRSSWSAPRTGSIGGYRNPGFDRSASSRGAASRGAAGAGGSSRGSGGHR